VKYPPDRRGLPLREDDAREALSVGGALLAPDGSGWVELPPAFQGRQFFSYDAALDGDGRLAIVVEEDTEEGLAVTFSVYAPGGPGAVEVTPSPRARPTAEEPEPSAVYRGNVAHTGTQPGPGPRGTFVLRWFVPIPDGASSPTLGEGTLYAGGGDGLLAVDALSGEEAWVHETTASVVGAPAVSDGRVYFVDAEQAVHAVGADGRSIWSVPGERAHASSRSSPTVADGVFYVGSSHSEDAVLALDAATGQEVWRFVAVENIDSTPTVVDGVLYVGGSNSSTRSARAPCGRSPARSPICKGCWCRR
jgi:outer membrane protein assembly factor BamB